jgi:hypothetical protein
MLFLVGSERAREENALATWQMYDELIAEVPEESVIAECVAGLHWCVIRSEGTGLAMAPREGRGVIRNAGRIAGMKTREVASWVKSWNMHEAALGLAAINSAINLPQRVQQTWEIDSSLPGDQDVFARLLHRLPGKKVAVIGHFRELERVAAVCQLSILERIPTEGDLPDPACEYMLAEQDFVFMTATTLINKTMPRLLELSRNAYVVVAGPSTPLTPVLLKYGVNVLGGLVVDHPERTIRNVKEGAQHTIFGEGNRMVQAPQQEVYSSQFAVHSQTG